MKPKKYPGKNLNRSKTLFFQIGLIATLVCILILVEWKTEARSNVDQETVTYLMLDDEEMPSITIPEEKLEPVPEPKPDVDDFIIDENEPETKEETPEPKEPVKDPVPLGLDDIEPIEDEPVKEMGFDVIEDVPIFPSCEQYKDNKDRKSCMSEQLKKFINKEFDTGLASDLGLKGINRIYTSFKIKANGEAEFINARAPHPKLKQESQRVIEKLPKMQPGKQRGNPVDVIFALPITFKVSE
ncbi:MAG: energy transducer TonB [Psychroflexus sp.]